MDKKLRSTKGLTEKQLLRLRRDELVAGILNARRTIQLERNRSARFIDWIKTHGTNKLKVMFGVS